MANLKKRKLEDTRNDVVDDDDALNEEIQRILESLDKPKLVQLLYKLGSQNPSIATEIKTIANADDPAKEVTSPDLVHRKLFVHGLGRSTNAKKLRAAYEKHGEIEEAYVIYDSITDLSRGYGFITYKHIKSVQEALSQPYTLIGEKVAVCELPCEDDLRETSSSVLDLSPRRLFIGGLPPEVTSVTLLNYFANYGKIEEGSVSYNKNTKQSRRYGFIKYQTSEAAKKAIVDLNEKTVWGTKISVKYAYYQVSKEGQQPIPSVVVQTAALPRTQVSSNLGSNITIPSYE